MSRNKHCNCIKIVTLGWAFTNGYIFNEKLVSKFEFPKFHQWKYSLLPITQVIKFFLEKKTFLTFPKNSRGFWKYLVLGDYQVPNLPHVDIMSHSQHWMPQRNTNVKIADLGHFDNDIWNDLNCGEHIIFDITKNKMK